MLEKVKEGKEKIVKGFNYLYFTTNKCTAQFYR